MHCFALLALAREAFARTRAQIVEEFIDLARQGFRRRSQVGGRRQHRRRGGVGLADGIAERRDVLDQRRVAFGSRLRIDRYLAGRRILLPDGTYKRVAPARSGEPAIRSQVEFQNMARELSAADPIRQAALAAGQAAQPVRSA